ncbi:hypothetical protein HAX54_004337 [Datura stramonium]|uniref:Uncharacterized protein n=1 Tax=Datura stramonium TaxID=4076 RepID=A0ABS8RTN6_DATST|nr:hypothetical protein [Datura stramonium]
MRMLRLREIIHMLRTWWFGLEPMICLKENCRQHRETLELMKIWRKYGTEWNDKTTILEEELTDLELQMMGQIDKKVDLPMFEESVTAPIPIINLVSDGEMMKTLQEEVAKIDKRTTLTRKRLMEAEQRITNIIKPSDRISGFEHHTRRPANNTRPPTQNGIDKTETSLSGESIGLSPNMSIVNHGAAKHPIFLGVFHHQCRSEVGSCSYLHEALRARGVLHLVDERPHKCISTNVHKICAYHAGQPGHTMDECLASKARLCMMIDDGQ